MQMIYILGPPGSGKGTQCQILQERYRCAHLSTGDLIRAERQKTDSPWAEAIQQGIQYGKSTPKELSVGLLKAKIDVLVEEGEEVVFVDGHLKQPDAAQYFEEQVGPIQLILEFKCPEDVLAERLLHRARADDKKANIQNRLEAFKGPTTEVLKIYRGYGKVAEYSVEYGFNLEDRARKFIIVKEI